MTRRVRRKVAKKGKDDAVSLSYLEIEVEDLGLERNGDVDWTSLPDDTVIQLFFCLNYRDRASLSSTCKTWRVLGASQCLWSSLDLRAHKFDTATATSLASRCVYLQKLRFRGAESADAIIHLQAKNLREISGDYCRKITDATLSVIVARHEALESLQLGPDFCERITGDAIKAVALCCPKLKKLWLSGIKDVYADAINALAKHCPNLVDVGFLDCLNVDEAALENVSSVRFLSVAGTSNMKWDVVSQLWHKLPKLIGLDVSRTDIGLAAISRLLSSSLSLKIFLENYLLYWPKLQTKGGMCFWIGRAQRTKIKSLNEIMTWLEWILSHTLLRTAESNPQGLDNFWLKQGAALLLSLMQSSQEDVQERAATGLATFVVIDDENASIDRGRAEAVMRDGGIRLLLNLAKSWHEGLQSEAAKALANLSVNANVAKAVAEEGGINILAALARSMNRLVAEEAAGGLWNLSVGEEHKAAIAEAGGVKALVDLIFKWSSGGDGVLERAAGALANLAADDKCSMEVAIAGGVHALVMLARNCKFEGVQEQAARLDNFWLKQGAALLLSLMQSSQVDVQERAATGLATFVVIDDENASIDRGRAEAVMRDGGIRLLLNLAKSWHEGLQSEAAKAARALANLASHGDSNSNNAAVGQEAGALEALVQLTRSPHEGVRQEAAGALWNLSFDDRNREAIAAAGGVEALVTLAQSCSNASPGLQERAAGALWGLSVSEANSIAIGREGGVAPLIALARSDAEDVHETAAGALWNLAFNHSNALRIVEEGGVPALVHLCSSSLSKMARFMAALALAYMFDGSRIDEFAPMSSSSESTSKSVSLDGARRMALKHIEAFIRTFSNPQAFAAAAASSAPAALAQVTEKARIQEAGHLRCSGAEIGRFVSMLRNSSSILKACAAFALLQFTIPGGRHAVHHASLMQGGGAARLSVVSVLAILES
ncbi:hypothetical protein GOBAR_AA05739 [Gossypium barbadense]|uniref:F-box domain-containing protein n=1 Tax=Gossypium barbadense TaxID=3634 RepID=A0A2P5YH13_GOSBA|nr:hypothetical protein GOBAR_AA05739 [Gossypium barbadense]